MNWSLNMKPELTKPPSLILLITLILIWRVRVQKLFWTTNYCCPGINLWPRMTPIFPHKLLQCMELHWIFEASPRSENESNRPTNRLYLVRDMTTLGWFPKRRTKMVCTMRQLLRTQAREEFWKFILISLEFNSIQEITSMVPLSATVENLTSCARDYV